MPDVTEPGAPTRSPVEGVDEAAMQRVEELARTRPHLTADDVVAALSIELEPDQLAEVHVELTRRGVTVELETADDELDDLVDLSLIHI